MFDINQLYYMVRIVVAGICGILIGLERRNRSKEAGVRTHFMVACASALMMVISKYGFGDVVSDRGVDGARLAAQVVSGVGFLGAGMIFVQKNTVTGLTTAAGIWATSGVGLAIGSGMYAVGVATSIIIVIAQIVLHKDFHKLKSMKVKKLTVSEVTEPRYAGALTEALEKYGIAVVDVYVEKESDKRDYTFTLEIPEGVYEDDILGEVEHKCKISANI